MASEVWYSLWSVVLAHHLAPGTRLVVLDGGDDRARVPALGSTAMAVLCARFGIFMADLATRIVYEAGGLKYGWDGWCEGRDVTRSSS